MSQIIQIFRTLAQIIQPRVWSLLVFLCFEALLFQIWMIPLWYIGLTTAIFLWVLVIESNQSQFGPPAKMELISPQSAIESTIYTILDSLPDSSFLVDQNGIVKFHNKIAKDQFNLVQPGDSLTLFFRTPAFVDAFNRVSLDGKMESVNWTQEVPTETVFEANISRLSFNSMSDTELTQNSIFYLVILHDLTELNRIEQMRADFVANASHELRTPLSSISGFIETLQGSAKRDPKSQQKFLTIMLEQTRRMSRLIDDLLSLSRIEVKSYVNRDVTTDLVSGVNHILATLSPIAREKSVIIEYLGQFDTAIINGEFDEIVQVIENITNNALAYGSDGGRIIIDLTRDSLDLEHPNWYLSIQDFGQGIDSLHIPRLTERFYRIESQDSTNKKGTGLGLSIVKHVINRHRGRLVIESEIGKGAKFTIILPALKEN